MKIAGFLTEPPISLPIPNIEPPEPKSKARKREVSRLVVPKGAGVAMEPPDFGRSVNPISTKRDTLCPPH